MYNEITAQEAFDQAVAKLDEIDISAELEDLYKHIKEGLERPSFGIGTPAMDFRKALKLGLHMEKLGYKSEYIHTGHTKIVEGEEIAQYSVSIHWMFFTVNLNQRSQVGQKF